jgi:sensor histidine kinase YesM
VADSILSDKRLRIFFAAWWIICMVLQYILLKEIGINDKYAITDCVIYIALLAASCFFISNNMRYYLPRNEKYWYILVISIAVSTICLLVHKGIIWILFSESDTFRKTIQATLMRRFGAGFLITSSISMISLLWYSQHEQNTIDERKAEADTLTRDAELYKLRQQLQPHFLFNSLNSISALTASQPEKARHMITQLSDFLRGTLKKEENFWNTLEEELKHLQLYLDIEKVRFGHRLETEVTGNNKTMPLKLPAMLLQPVVENAIKFGLYDTIGNVLITIHAVEEKNYLKIVVQNPFDPETSQPLKGTGFGLSSVKRRLFLLFGRNDLLSTQHENDHFITTIFIPQIV